MKWISLTDLGQLKDIAATDSEKISLIFKHSTRCSVSRMALKQFENEFNIADDKIDTYFLDLLNYRAVSNEISTQFNVEHQSPQMLVFKNGQVLHVASHSAIDAADLNKFIS